MAIATVRCACALRASQFAHLFQLPATESSTSPVWETRRVLSLSRLAKPEYLHRPWQFVERLRAMQSRHSGEITVRLPWGHPITVDPAEMIGSAVVRLGVYDLVVTETLWRLADRGEHAIDVGANVGCMTSVLAFRCGREGHVVAFEPHPAVCRRLRTNVEGWPEARGVDVVELALGDQSGSARLVVPEGFSKNTGTASLAGDLCGAAIDVRIERLDDALAATATPVVAKIDVEGFELPVLRGGRRVLSGLRDVIFEGNDGYPGAVSDDLERQGFTIFRLEKSLRRPLLVDPRDTPRSSWDAQSFLATRDVLRAEARFDPAGWKCL